MLAQKLRIPKAKLEFVFQFLDVGDLKPIPGGRGSFIFYSTADYYVELPRRLFKGKAEDA